MMKLRRRPTPRDVAQGIAYVAIAVWAVVLFFVAPEAFKINLDFALRSFWLGITAAGALLAALGAFTRIDIKLELPGIIFTLLGPLIYFGSQLYFVTFPDVGVDPSQRVALVVYAIIPALLLLPRALDIYLEARRIKKLSRR